MDQTTDGGVVDELKKLLKIYDIIDEFRSCDSNVISREMLTFARDNNPLDVVTESGPQSVYTISRVAIWFVCSGCIELEDIIIKRGPPTLSRISGIIRTLQTKHAMSHYTEEYLGCLNILVDYMKVVHRFQLIPSALIDTKYCTECLYEINHSMDTIADELENLNCSHMLVRHDVFKDDDDETVRELCEFRGIGNEFFGKMFGKKPERHDAIQCDDDMIMNTKMFDFLDGNIDKTDLKTSIALSCGATGFSRDKFGFSLGLEYIRCTTQIEKWKKTVDSHERTMDVIHKTVVDFMSPRYPNRFMTSVTAELIGSYNKKKLRLNGFDGGSLKYDHTKTLAKLITTIPKNHEAVLNLVAIMTVDPIKVYNRKYTVVTPRIRLFKYMLSLGYSTIFAYKTVTFLRDADLPSILNESRNSFVVRVCRIAKPDPLLICILKITWVMVHLLAYKITMKFKNSYIKRGDYPGDLYEPGFYIFDDDNIGYCLNDGNTIRTRKTNAENIVGLIGDYELHYGQMFGGN